MGRAGGRAGGARLTGHVTEKIDKECVEKAISIVRVPEGIDVIRGMLRLALEDLRI